MIDKTGSFRDNGLQIIFTDCESTKYGTIRYYNCIKEG